MFFSDFQIRNVSKNVLEPWESEGSLGLVELVRARRSFKAKIKAPHSAKHWRHERDLYDFKLSNLNHELWIIRGQDSTHISDPSHKKRLSLPHRLKYNLSRKIFFSHRITTEAQELEICYSKIIINDHNRLIRDIKIERAPISKLFEIFRKKFKDKMNAVLTLGKESLRGKDYFRFLEFYRLKTKMPVMESYIIIPLFRVTTILTGVFPAEAKLTWSGRLGEVVPY